MRVFKTKDFARFARKERIAIARANRGQIDADLGGGVIKQRVPRRGQGRSGGYRTLIAYRSAERSVFMLGFAKSDQDSIDADDLEKLKAAARVVLNFSEADIREHLADRRWLEIECDA